MVEKLKNFKFKDKAYDVIKWILFTGVAPTITLIIGLGKLYNFDPTLIVGTISLFASFLGAITGLSNYNYNKDIEETIESNYQKPQNKTGDYGQKRKPGDYLK